MGGGEVNKLTTILLCTIMAIPMGKMREGYKYGEHLVPESKFTKSQLQEFRVKVMEQVWYKSGKLTQEEWYAKLSNHCRSNNMYPSLCSYCDCVIQLNIGLAGISHGICPNCMEKAYLENDLLPDPEMLDAQKEFNKKNKVFEIFLKRS